MPAEVRWLLVSALAVVLVRIALLVRRIQVEEEARPVNRAAGRVLFLSSFVILLLGFTNLSTIPLLLALNLLLLAPGFYGFKVWVGMLVGTEADTTVQSQASPGTRIIPFLAEKRVKPR